MTPVAKSTALVMIVEDSATARALMKQPLLERFSVVSAASGESALEMAKDARPDAIVLDVNLPDMDGFEVCRRVRMFSDAFIIMLTVRDAEDDRIQGLTVGADDYLAKPFSQRELALRVEAMLRRGRPGLAPVLADAPDSSAPGSTAAEPQPLRVGDLALDPLAREVHVAGEPKQLTRVEFDLLHVLVAHPRIVLSAEAIMESVWDTSWYGDSHTLQTHVSNLRRKLGDDARNPRFVRVVRGIGYRLGPCVASGALSAT